MAVKTASYILLVCCIGLVVAIWQVICRPASVEASNSYKRSLAEVEAERRAHEHEVALPPSPNTVQTANGPMAVYIGVTAFTRGLRLFPALIKRGSTDWTAHVGQQDQMHITADAEIQIADVALSPDLGGTIARDASATSAWIATFTPKQTGTYPVAITISGTSSPFTVNVKVLP